MNDRAFLTVAEVAQRIGVSRERAYQLIDNGTIPNIRLSERRIRIPVAAFEQWLAELNERALNSVKHSIDNS